MAGLPREVCQSSQEPQLCMYVCVFIHCVCTSKLCSVCVVQYSFYSLSLSLSLSQTRKPEEVEPELQEIIADYQEYKAKKLGM